MENSKLQNTINVHFKGTQTQKATWRSDCLHAYTLASAKVNCSHI